MDRVGGGRHRRHGRLRPWRPRGGVHRACGARTSTQSQALASSTDGGLTWRKHGVVLDIGSTDFRDPRLLRHGDRWLMAVARSRDDAIALYSSPDLRTWTHGSDVAMPSGQGSLGVPRPVPAR